MARYSSIAEASILLYETFNTTTDLILLFYHNDITTLNFLKNLTTPLGGWDVGVER